MNTNHLAKDKIALAAAAALTFNNWLLAIFLNHKLLSKAGSVSEFSAAGQPHSTVFRSLDVLSGGLVVVLAWLIYKMRQRSLNALAIGLAVFGIANMADALYTLNCSETLSSSCTVPVHISLHNFSLPSHAYSSIIIGICYLVLPAIAYIKAKQFELSRLKIASAGAVVVATLSLVSVLVSYLASGSFSEKAWGPSQEIQMLVIGIWLIVLAANVFLDKKFLPEGS